jgi:hypothetical protein
MTDTERIQARIQQLVREFLDNHVGGEKFNAVLTHVLYSMRVSDEYTIASEEVKAAIAEMQDVKMLIYGWNMSGWDMGQSKPVRMPNLWQERIFVYTPLPT